MSRSSKIYFFFPFLKNLAYLGMQTVSSLYFGIFGFILSSAATFLVQKQGQATPFWPTVISGSLALSFLGSLFGTYFFNSVKKNRSPFEILLRSLIASLLIAVLAWPLTGFIAAILENSNAGRAVSMFSEAFKRAYAYTSLPLTPFGITVSGFIFASGIFYRTLIHRLSSGKNPEKTPAP